ncbi:NUDIX hydrolase [Pseudomonas sp. SST3]|jgi:coenzyme A diphosphatase NUDT7|uniref:NUDIX hydrolase n=1 Tax=Pseudomonas sp. SST3 TaxID=2267882 RepID=UPI000E043B66|nr:CoA pyrophosphatase [Pseudomonas sp. SST3]NKQ12735.1 CoA pyrophosphatase [Pseudomonas sp. SST3]
MPQSLTDALTRLLAHPPGNERLPRAHWPTTAAVLIPVLWKEPECSVVMTRRTHSLRQHAGEICLPGGKMDAHDQGSVIRASLREAEEELGLSAGGVLVGACLPKLETSSGLVVHPVVGLIDRPPIWKLQPAEVSEVLEIPLALFMDLDNYRREVRRYRGRLKESLIVDFGNAQVWGLTARILFALRRELYS